MSELNERIQATEALIAARKELEYTVDGTFLGWLVKPLISFVRWMEKESAVIIKEIREEQNG